MIWDCSCLYSARSAAVPEFGKDACGQTLTWSYELGRWEIKDSREVVAENRTVVRISCQESADAINSDQ